MDDKYEGFFLFDDEGNEVNKPKTPIEEEDTGFFGSLFEQDDLCPECGYEGALKLTKYGWKCPKCRTLLIPTG